MTRAFSDDVRSRVLAASRDGNQRRPDLELASQQHRLDCQRARWSVVANMADAVAHALMPTKTSSSA